MVTRSTHDRRHANRRAALPMTLQGWQIRLASLATEAGETGFLNLELAFLCTLKATRLPRELRAAYANTVVMHLSLFDNQIPKVKEAPPTPWVKRS